MKKIITLFLALACFLTSYVTCNASGGNVNQADTIVDAYDSLAIRNDIISYYNLQSKSNLTFSYTSSNYIYIPNLNQASLEAQYWAQTGYAAIDSCPSVAVVDLVKYYKGSMDTATAYVNFVNQAYINGYFTSNRGQLKSDKYKAGITLCASQNGISGTGEEYTFNKRARTRNALNAGQPVLLSLHWVGHAVVATGVEKYTVSYTENGNVHSFVVEYFMVNENVGRAGGSLILSQRFSDSTGGAFILKR